jgi:beta-lactamase class A
MWMRTHRYEIRRGLQLFGIGCAALYVCQFLYPPNRTLPFVQAGGQGIGAQSTTSAAEVLAKDYQKAQFVVTTDDTRSTISLARMGAKADAATAARKAADYPFAVRLIPFSSLYIMAARNTPVYATFKGDGVADFAAQTQKNAQREAVNATVVIKDGTARVQAAVPSKTYAPAATEQTLRRAAYTPGATIHLQPHTMPAKRTNADVQPLADTANAAIKQPPKLVIAGKTVKVKGGDVASWLHFPEDAATGKLTMALKEDVVAAYLTKVQGDAYVAPGKTTVRTVDDREVSRDTGKPGRGVDAAAAVLKILTALQSGKQQSVDLPVGDIAPVIAYDRIASNTDKGLTDIVAQQAQAKGGFGISVMEINGRSSNANGDKQFIAASTYKLFVSYVWFKRVEAGKASWSDTINGQRADKCFEIMIVNSDNPCAKAFAAAVGGWSVVDASMKSIGLRHTSLTTANLYTTANDLSYFMYRLENGTLVPGADRTRLIDLMKRQVYRDGIPAGTKTTVADKVGFVDGYLNDAGIVYAHKGTYVMVIMSYGSTWAQVADAAKQIHDYLQ